jgi:hypothetical protein
MPIFRGIGGSGDSSTDAYASQVAFDAQTATTKANEAEASATAAAASVSAVSTDATAAEAAKIAAELAENNAETAENNAANSATAAAASAAAAAATAAAIGDLDSLSDVTVTTPSTGQVLKYNGSAWVNDTDAGGLANIVEDTTPQLGGTLDANGNTIDMGTNTITDTKVGQWDTAYGWGDHSVAGYSTTTTDTASVAKAWVAFDQSTDSILDDYNVTSITRNATGTYTITFDTAFANTSYCLVSTAGANTTNAGDHHCAIIPMTTTTCKLQIYNTSTQLTSNGDFCSVVAFDN